MPRYCKTCQTSHDKPTGRGCNRNVELVQQAEPAHPDQQNAMLAVLTDIQQQMLTIQQRLSSVEAGENQPQVAVDKTVSNLQVPTQNPAQHTENTTRATPETLRMDPATMADVAAKMAEWGLQEDVGDTPRQGTHPWGIRRKKSGTVSTGTDVIKKSIDWPHFHIRKGPTRTPPEFKQLTSEEFVVGFIRMIRSPGSTYDNDRMLEILQEVMEDAADFGWEKARAYYGMLGLDIEYNKLDWADKHEMLELRLTYAMTLSQDTQTKTSPTNPRQPTKPCPSYQSGSCDQLSDHDHLRHVCDYCFRERNFTFHHPESECRTKRLHDPKNS